MAKSKLEGEDIIFIVYVDDGIFLGTSYDQLSNVIKELTDIGLSKCPLPISPLPISIPKQCLSFPH
ncbi:hypothetical protein ACHAW6_014688 [Cyclotella cf. meneghiniana]